MCPSADCSGLAPIAFIVAGVAFIAILVARGNVLNAPAAQSSDPRAAAMPAHSEGALLYNRYCFVCHGTEGRGDGPAAHVLDPRPRDFRLGKYRVVSTANGIPSKGDLIRTIRSGMPGTSMPAWRHFTDAEIEAVADYCYSFTKAGIREQLASRKLKPAVLESILKSKTTAGEKVTIPPEPPVSSEELEKGRVLFEANCAKCHNSDGSGKQDPSWKTDVGFPIASRNFTTNIFKGGGRGADIYTRISTGLTGTPMASFGSLPPEDIWRLVHYVQSLADPTRPRPTTSPTTAPAPPPAPVPVAAINREP